jgi:hypothetical protein
LELCPKPNDVITPVPCHPFDSTDRDVLNREEHHVVERPSAAIVIVNQLSHACAQRLGVARRHLGEITDN